VRDRVGLANVGKKLVTQAFALGSAGDQSRDIHELDDRGDDLLGLRQRGERVEPGIGHLHDAGIRLDRAERIILGRDPGLGERIEQRRLADVGQTDDTALEGHDEYAVSSER
jgi:hypothetical protein